MPHSKTKAGNSNKSNVAHLIVSLRWFILGMFAILLLGAGYYASTFKINASAETLLVKNNPLYIQAQKINQTFSPDEFILLAYKPKNSDVFSHQTFNTITNLSQQFAQLERVKSVVSVLNVPLLDTSTELSTGTNIAALTWQQQQYSPQRVKQLLQDHPIYTDLLINQAQTALAIQIVFKSNAKLTELDNAILAIQQHSLERELTRTEKAEIERLQQQAAPIRYSLTQQRSQEIEQINQIIATTVTDGTTYMGGSYVVGQHLVDIIQSDLQLFGTAITVVIALLLFLIYRNLIWTILPLAMCACSVLLTVGIFGLLELKATVISANFIALQIILTLAVIIHLVNAYQHSVNNQDYAHLAHVEHMLSSKFLPCLYATITTSVGFGSLILSGIQPVVTFGVMMVLAMLATMTTALLLFPAILGILPIKQQSSVSILDQFVSLTEQLNHRYPKPLIIINLLVFSFMALGMMRLDVENSFIHYFAEDTTVREELTFIDQEFGGSTPLDVVIEVPASHQKPDLLVSAMQVNETHLAQAVLNQFEAVGSVTSLASFTQLAKQVNQNKPLTEYELNTLYTLLDKDVAKRLVGSYINEQGTQIRIATRIQDTTPDLNRQSLLDNIRADLLAIGLTAERTTLSNLFVLYQDILSRLFDSQIKTLGFVYLALLVVLLVIFRSAKYAVIALIPNILTTLGILGLIGWLNIPLDLMTITIASVAMGIAMDDTIHFVHSFKSANQPEEAIQRAFQQAGKPILVTSLVIACGFAMFMFSDFIPSVYFGALTATAMSFALITDLTILPALLKVFAEPKQAE